MRRCCTEQAFLARYSHADVFAWRAGVVPITTGEIAEDIATYLNQARRGRTQLRVRS